MASTYFLIGLIIFIVISIYLSFKYANDDFLVWLENSKFTNKEITFTLNRFGFFDLIHIFLTVVSVAMLWISIKFLIESNFPIFLFAFSIFLLHSIFPLLHFYKKWLFFKINYLQEYNFNPIQQSLTIISYNHYIVIFENNIQKLEAYNISGKVDFSFKIIQLKTGEKILLSSDLPFTDNIGAFFKNIHFEHHKFGPFDIFKMLTLLKTFV